MNFLSSHRVSVYSRTARGTRHYGPTRRNMPGPGRLNAVRGVKKQSHIDFPLDAILPGSQGRSANQSGGRRPAAAARLPIGRLTDHMG